MFGSFGNEDARKGTNSFYVAQHRFKPLFRIKASANTNVHLSLVYSFLYRGFPRHSMSL